MKYKLSKEEIKRTVFKLEVFDDFKMDSFFALPHLGTVKGETLDAKAISQSCEYLIEIFRISLSPKTRKKLLDTLDLKFSRGEM